MPGNASVICDAQGNMVAGYAGTNLAATQPALATAGSDYATPPKAQVPKIDAFGTQYVASANPAGQASQVYTGQTAPAAANQYGDLTMVRQDSPAPARYLPLTSDMQGALNVHSKSKQTFRALANGVTCSAGKSIFSMVYAGTGTMVLRLNEVCIYVPPSGASGSLLGTSNNTYYALICELRRITSATGGAAVTPVTSDSNDPLTTGVSCASGATVSATVNTYHRQDAVVTTGTGLPWYGRYDPGNEKTLVIRPGEGFSITCVSSGTINSPSGGSLITASVDIELVFTQAVA